MWPRENSVWVVVFTEPHEFAAPLLNARCCDLVTGIEHTCDNKFEPVHENEYTGVRKMVSTDETPAPILSLVHTRVRENGLLGKRIITNPHRGVAR